MLTTLRNRDFCLLWFAGLISIMGDWVLYAALPLYAYQQTDSALASGAVFAAMTLPGILIGSVAGVFVDRFDRKRTMIYTNVFQALVLLPLLAVSILGYLWPAYAVVFLISMASKFFSPAENALLPRRVASRGPLARGSDRRGRRVFLLRKFFLRRPRVLLQSINLFLDGEPDPTH